MTVDFDEGWSQEDKPVEDDEEDLAVAAEWAVVSQSEPRLAGGFVYSRLTAADKA
jgi:hypothetical protein